MTMITIIMVIVDKDEYDNNDDTAADNDDNK